MVRHRVTVQVYALAVIKILCKNRELMVFVFTEYSDNYSLFDKDVMSKLILECVYKSETVMNWWMI